MTIFDLALNNVKKNFYNYFLYFLSMIISIIIYFTFQSIKVNKQVIELSEKSLKINSAFNAATVVLAIFVAIFIWYSNSFFTMKRKKEIAIYSMLGVRKKQIGRMLFYENIFMGLLAIIIGVCLGSVFSKFFTDILIKMMGLNLKVNFTLEFNAVITTLLIFLAIFLVTSIHSYTIIYRFKLIELFKAESSADNTITKIKKSYYVLALLSLILIGFGYYLSWEPFNPNKFIRITDLNVIVLSILTSIIVGTYMFFKCFTIFMVTLLKKNKTRHYKGLNMVQTAQLQHRLKSNARTLATIAILSATTLTAIGFTFDIYYTSEKSARNENPFDIQYIQKAELENTINSIIPNDNIKFSTTLNLLKTEASFNGNIEPLKFFDIREEKTFLYLISETEYNKVINQMNLKDSNVNLKNNSNLVILHLPEGKFLDPKYEGTKFTLTPKTNPVELNTVSRMKLDLTSGKTGGLIGVVSDDLYNSFKNKSELVKIKSIMIKDVKNSKTINEKLNTTFDEETRYNKLKLSSFYESYSQVLQSTGMLLFIGSFLGLVFLTATGSIIYFKQLSEATEEKKRYEILSKIGVNGKEIKKSIAKQMIIVFGLPLVIGVLHSTFALQILGGLLNANIITPTIISFTAYTLIYVSFYYLTVDSYYNIVKTS